jgi:hypothetical protein
MSKIKFISFLILCAGLISCRKKELPKPVTPPIDTSGVTKGVINFKIKNVVGNKPLALGELVSYSLANGDQFTISTYNYYLSNFVFTDKNGNRFVEPESYHLVKANMPESLEFSVSNVPSAEYVSVEFLIGVDSARNFSGAQVGWLDPQYEMFWTWKTGYIMAKLEGRSPQSANTNNSISYHIAGVKGANNVLQKVQISLPSSATVAKEKSPTLFMQSNAETWFTSTNFPGFSMLASIGVEGNDAVNMAKNYSKMMSVVSVENQ